MVVTIRDVGGDNLDDLCQLCITENKSDDPTFIRGVAEKRKWAVDMLHRWGSFAKLAYAGTSPAGLIQYEPIPGERAVRIHCIYVPEERYWRKGIARQLLAKLIAEVRTPGRWFGNESALALVTRTFPGEQPGQYPARLFFAKMGFRQIGGDPDFLYYPVEEGFIYRPVVEKQVEYVPQQEDRGKVLFIYGPSPCPFSYVFLKRAEQAIEALAPGVPIRWLNRAEEPDEAERRGNAEGCIVNARYMKSFVFNEEAFQKEVMDALHGMEGVT